MIFRLLTLLALLVLAFPLRAATKTRNIIFVMTDGLRSQEVFEGAELSLINAAPLGTDAKKAALKAEALSKSYWREDGNARRQALMPFLWSTISEQGQIYGNRALGSDAHVTNGLNFSYPGYSETLCGFADPRINSNDKVPNLNVTVLEWLDQKPAFKGKVAAFGAWDVFPFIFNAERARFPVNAGYEPFTATPLTPQMDLLNRLKAESPRIWEDESFDNLAYHTAEEYLKANQPRVLYLSLGETDDWAHAGDYGNYLESAHRVDSYLKTLWELVQALPAYRDKTTLIFSPDHGRGLAPTEWKSHGEKIAESKYIWMAFLGPDTKPLGERSHILPVTQNQIAATLAALLGEDYSSDVPQAGKPLADVITAAGK